MIKSALVTLLVLVGCSRGAPHYPHDGQDAARSTFKVEISIDGEEVGTGTAWIYKTDTTGTYLLTAGHVCPLSEGVNSYVLVAQDNTKHLAFEVMRADEPDLCVLRSLQYLGEPLAFADRMPKYDDGLYVVGAPSGHYGDGLAPIYHGFYAGAGMATGATIPGLSGSAVISSRGVVGVLVEGWFRDNIYHMMTLDEINGFLAVK